MSEGWCKYLPEDALLCSAKDYSRMFSLNVLSAQFDGALLSTSMLFLFVLSVLLATHLKKPHSFNTDGGLFSIQNKISASTYGRQRTETSKDLQNQPRSTQLRLLVLWYNEYGTGNDKKTVARLPSVQEASGQVIRIQRAHIYPNGQNSCKGLGLPGKGRKIEISRHNEQSSNVITNQ